ncbi:MAG: HIT family protein [Patescibacteria group bacterium]
MADYKSTTKEGECIFCKIISGDIKTPGIFWENDEFMAFLSIWPNTEGFTVVIPKEHYGSDVLGMPDNKLNKFVLAAKTVSKNLIKHFEDVGRVGLIMEGTGIDHAHIKLFPMHGTGYMKKGEWKQYHSKNDQFFEIYEGYITSNDGPKADEEKIKKLAQKLREIK